MLSPVEEGIEISEPKLHGTQEEYDCPLNACANGCKCKVIYDQRTEVSINSFKDEIVGSVTSLSVEESKEICKCSMNKPKPCQCKAIPKIEPKVCTCPSSCSSTGRRKTPYEPEESFQYESLPSERSFILEEIDNSHRISLFLLERQRRHENALKQMHNEIRSIDCQHMTWVEELSIILKDEKKTFEKMIANERNRLEKLDILNEITEDMLNDIWQNIQSNWLVSLKEAMKDFIDTLEKNDRKRIEKIKEIMADYSLLIESIGHLLPLDIQVLLDSEVLKYDQEILLNIRVRKSFCQLISKNILRTLWSFRAFLFVLLRNHKYALDLELQRQEELKRLMYDPLDEKYADWEVTLAQQINDINFDITNCLERYKTSINKIFYCTDDYQHKIFSESDISQNIQIPFCTPSFIQIQVDTILQDQTKEVYYGEVQSYFDTVQEIKASINNHIDFVDAADGLWNKHVKRQNEMKQQVEAETSKVIKNSENQINSKELEIMTAAEKMRFNTTLQNITIDIKHIEQKIKGLGRYFDVAAKNQLTKIQTITDRISAEATLIQKEVTEVLQSYAAIEKFSFHYGEYSPTNELSMNEEETALEIIIENELEEEIGTPVFIRQLLIEVEHLASWKSGLVEILTRYVAKSERCMLLDSVDWLICRQNRIHRNLKKNHEDLLQYVRNINEMYDTRFAEIILHTLTIERHTKALYVHLEKLIASGFEFPETVEHTIDDLRVEMNEIIADHLKAKSIGDAAVLVIRAQSAYLEKVKYVMTTEDKLIDYVKNKFTYLKSINENYKNNIRHIKDGGNFNDDEQEDYMSKLELIDDILYEKEEFLTNRTTQKVLNTLKNVYKRALKTLLSIQSEFKLNLQNGELADEIMRCFQIVNQFSETHLRALEHWIDKFNDDLTGSFCDTYERAQFFIRLPYKLEYFNERLKSSINYYTYKRLIVIPEGNLNDIRYEFYTLVFDPDHKDPHTSPVHKKRTPSIIKKKIDFHTEFFLLKPNHEIVDPNGCLSANMNLYEYLINILFRRFEIIERVNENFFNKKKKERLKVFRTDIIPSTSQKILDHFMIHTGSLYMEYDQKYALQLYDMQMSLSKYQHLLNIYSSEVLSELHSKLLHSLMQLHSDFDGIIKRLITKDQEKLKYLAENDKLFKKVETPGNSDRKNRKSKSKSASLVKTSSPIFDESESPVIPISSVCLERILDNLENLLPIMRNERNSYVNCIHELWDHIVEITSPMFDKSFMEFMQHPSKEIVQSQEKIHIAYHIAEYEKIYDEVLNVLEMDTSARISEKTTDLIRRRKYEHKNNIYIDALLDDGSMGAQQLHHLSLY